MRYQSTVTVIPTEKTIFAIAHQTCPDLKSTSVSKLNVEKVLNPPVKPTITKKYQKFFSENKGSNFPKANPNTITAKTLASKVPSGMSCLKYVSTPFVTPNRAMLPNPPPINMAKN